MFLKPFRVKSQTAVKGSDRKKLRQELCRQYPDIDEDEVCTVIPSKEDMLTMKIYTHSGETVQVYLLNKNPIFFEVETTLYPTVYTTWKYPEMMPVFTTWPAVLKKLIGGADLMLPGVITRGDATPAALGNLKKRALCAVKLLGNKAPIAVGKTALSSEEMYEAAMRGKGVIIMHTYKDYLWAHGDKSDPPLLEDQDFSASLVTDSATSDSVQNNEVASAEPIKGTGATVNGACGEQGDMVECTSTDLQALSLGRSDESTGRTDDCPQNSGGSSEADAPEESDDDDTGNAEVDTRSAQEKMDDLLMWCFKCALKVKVTKSDLPLLTSTFQRNFLLSCCPQDKYLDLKKTSYKKLSKFLQAMKKEGYINVKELSKGVDSITEIHKDHPQLRQFQVDASELPTEGDKEETDGATAGSSYQPPQVADVYQVTTNTLPLFKPAGQSKGSALSAQGVRKILVDYVKENQLQDQNKKGFVRLDPMLSDMVQQKDDYREMMRWEDILAALLAKMTAAYQITFPGQAAHIKKGKLETINFTIANRMGNKKVTLIENLETYCIDPSAFAHEVQVGVSVSASVAPHPAKKTGMQVTLQGNQINYITQLLTDKYKLPRKWLSGLDKAPKSGKKKR